MKKIYSCKLITFYFKTRCFQILLIRIKIDSTWMQVPHKVFWEKIARILQVKSHLESEGEQKKSICKLMDQLIIMMHNNSHKMLSIRVSFLFFHNFLDLLNAVN